MKKDFNDLKVGDKLYLDNNTYFIITSLNTIRENYHMITMYSNKSQLGYYILYDNKINEEKYFIYIPYSKIKYVEEE